MPSTWFLKEGLESKITPKSLIIFLRGRFILLRQWLKSNIFFFKEN